MFCHGKMLAKGGDYIKLNKFKVLVLILIILITFIIGCPVKKTQTVKQVTNQNSTIIYETAEAAEKPEEKIVKELVEEKVNKKQNYKYIGEFEVTAYDLSIQSCSKPKSHPQYGITATGFDLKNKSIEDIKIIAVDPKVIPLHSKVYIEFAGWRSKYNGVYLAKDTGGAIKGNKIDIFMEDTGDKVVSKKAMKFGRVKGVKVWLAE